MHGKVNARETVSKVMRRCRLPACQKRLPASRYFYCRTCMREITEDTFRSYGIEEKLEGRGSQACRAQ